MEILKKSQKDDIALEAASKYPKIIEAANILTLCAFMTSPLDVLIYIHKALLVIKEFAVSVVGQAAASAFEYIFGLFFLAFVRSDIPTPEQTLAFAINFSPQRGLAGPLEYAKSTATAASIQCDALAMLIK